MAGRSRVRFTSAADGDLAIGQPAPEVAARRRAVVDLPWSWLRQVHGDRVVTVVEPGGGAGAEADAAVTATPGAALAVHTADCGPIALTAEGVVGVVHAGWRGLDRGVVAAAVQAMRDLGAGEIRAELGPLIRPRCYEFDAAELERLTDAWGPSVRATTAWDTPAFDLAAAIGIALNRAGVSSVADAGTCTACSPGHWSYRADRATARQAVVAWLEP